MLLRHQDLNKKEWEGLQRTLLCVLEKESNSREQQKSSPLPTLGQKIKPFLYVRKKLYVNKIILGIKNPMGKWLVEMGWVEWRISNPQRVVLKGLLELFHHFPNPSLVLFMS
ncbi:hypothetical protein V6N13_062845 [Hibiscus sabdariffa]